MYPHWKWVTTVLSPESQVINLTLDLLMRNLIRMEIDLRYSCTINAIDYHKSFQAHADNLLLLPNSFSRLTILIDKTWYFMNYAPIHFNSDKCMVIKYDTSGSFDLGIVLSDQHNADIAISWCDANDTVKYLEVLIGIRRLAKIGFNNEKILKVKRLIDRVRESGLKICQVINTIRTFILPRSIRSSGFQLRH
jgi:hypothetical protein